MSHDLYWETHCHAGLPHRTCPRMTWCGGVQGWWSHTTSGRCFGMLGLPSCSQTVGCHISSLPAAGPFLPRHFCCCSDYPVYSNGAQKESKSLAQEKQSASSMSEEHEWFCLCISNINGHKTHKAWNLMEVWGVGGREVDGKKEPTEYRLFDQKEKKYYGQNWAADFFHSKSKSIGSPNYSLGEKLMFTKGCRGPVFKSGGEAGVQPL